MHVRLTRGLAIATLTFAASHSALAQLPRSPGPGGGAARANIPDDASIRSAIGKTHPAVLRGAAENQVVWLFLNESGAIVASGLSEPSPNANSSDMIPIAIGPARKGGVFAPPGGGGEGQPRRSPAARPNELPMPKSVGPDHVLTDSTNAIGVALRRYKSGEMGPATVTVVLVTVR